MELRTTLTTLFRTSDGVYFYNFLVYFFVIIIKHLQYILILNRATALTLFLHLLTLK